MIKTDEVFFQSKGHANAVLISMKNLLNRYERVLFADFLELSGLSSTFEDCKYHWTDLSEAKVKKVKNAFVIDFPPTVKLGSDNKESK